MTLTNVIKIFIWWSLFKLKTNPYKLGYINILALIKALQIIIIFLYLVSWVRYKSIIISPKYIEQGIEQAFAIVASLSFKKCNKFYFNRILPQNSVSKNNTGDDQSINQWCQCSHWSSDPKEQLNLIFIQGVSNVLI